MGSNGRFERARGIPADLVAALLATGLVDAAAFAPVLRDTPVRVPVGIAFLLVVPGYVVVAALFPDRERVDGVDRLSLSVVASVIAVSAVGLAMNATPWGIRLEPTLAAVSLVTVAVTLVAAHRRLAVPPANRVRVPYRTWARRGATAVRPNGAADLALTLSLAVAVAFAVGVVGFAIVDAHADYGPGFGEDDGFSAISLLDSEGDLLTNESEATFEPGESETFRVGIDNHEGTPTDYTVVALERELADDGSVADERERDRFEVAVDDGETVVYDHELGVDSESTAEERRFVWLLYPDEAPDDPSRDTAAAYVSVTVSDGASES